MIAKADARMDEYLTHMPAIQFIPVRDHAFVLRSSGVNISRLREVFEHVSLEIEAQ